MLIAAFMSGALVFILADCVGGTLQMISGSAVVDRVTILDAGLIGGAKVVDEIVVGGAVVVGFLGLQVSSSSPTKIKM